jgi:hypothetical protein
LPIDPVILLAEEIRSLEKQIHAAVKREAGAYDHNRAEAVNHMLDRLRILFADLLETSPISAPGAGELIRIAARRLPFSQGRYADHLYRIADRLASGDRQQSDLIWLRALAEALGEEVEAGKGGNRTAKLLASAIKGMALPIVVWRAALPSQPPMRDLHTLLAGPAEPARFMPQSI